jgi:hypothetical protein
MSDTQNQFPDPQAGGRYERNADGSLTLVHETKEASIVPAGAGAPQQPDPAGADGSHQE